MQGVEDIYRRFGGAMGDAGEEKVGGAASAKIATFALHVMETTLPD